MRYLVKFTVNGKTRYGVAREHDKDAKALKARGLVLVEDAVLPVAYEVRESDVVDVEVKLPGRFDSATGLWTDLGEYDAWVQARYQEAKATSDAITEGVGVGSMFRLGVGDGYAHYVVVKVNKRTCKVEWRGFCADRWHDHHFGLGGSFPIADVARYINGERAMTRLFARRG